MANALLAVLAVLFLARGAEAAGWSNAPGRVPRFEGRYERLGDGRILAVGGDSQSGLFAGPTATEIYNPRTGAWKQVAPLPEPRGWPFTAVLDEDHVLLVGGWTANGVGTATGFVYSIKADRWAKLKNPLPIDLANTHCWMDAPVLPGGQVLIAGGWSLAGGFPGFISTRSFVFTPGRHHPEDGTWSETGPLSAPRSTASVLRLDDGRFLHVGGIQEPLAFTTTATGDIFNPRTMTWSAIPPMPPTTTDDNLADFGYTEALNTDGNAGSRWQPLAAVLGNGEVLVAGGATFGFTNFVIRKSAVIFNPRRNTWRETAPLSEWRDGGRGAALRSRDDEVLFIGRSHFGFTDDLSVEKFVEGERWVPISSPTSDPTLSSFGGFALQVERGLLFLVGAVNATPGDLVASGTNFLFVPGGR